MVISCATPANQSAARHTLDIGTFAGRLNA